MEKWINGLMMRQWMNGILMGQWITCLNGQSVDNLTLWLVSG